MQWRTYSVQKVGNGIWNTMREWKVIKQKETWNTEISEIRKQKRARCEDSPDTIQDDDIPTPEVNLTNLSIKQLRELIKEKGLRPKGLSRL